MILIIITVSAALLKYLEFSFMAQVSWAWIIGLFVVTVLWFEFFERMLGLDKRRAHDEFDRIQKERAKRAFEQKTK